MSQYENALSVHLQEHLIRLAHQQTFFPSSLSPSPEPRALSIFDLSVEIPLYANEPRRLRMESENGACPRGASACACVLFGSTL